MATSRSNPINPNPCESSPEEIENFTNIRELFEQVFPKVGCATANWSMTGGFYPSHPSYPSCPTLVQLCTVPVVVGSENFTVLLPCPRSRDPNIETGDSVMFQQDFDKNSLYMGGHDDAIGSVKWFHGLPAEVPRGWRWLDTSPPANTHTRTGRWANAKDKYVKNTFSIPGGTDPTLGLLGMGCATSSVDVTVNVTVGAANATFTIDDHASTLTSQEFTNIGLTWNLDTDSAYIDPELYMDCLDDHYHELSIQNTQDFGMLPCGYPDTTCLGMARGILQDFCTTDEQYSGCTGSTDLCPTGYIEATYHSHDVTGYITLHDPGHKHIVNGFVHTINQTPHTHPASADGSGSNVKIPRVYLLLIERYNNAANASSGAAAAGVYCD